MKYLIAFVMLALISTSAMAQTKGRCDDRAPYYHRTMPNSIGAKLADLFLLPGTLAVTALTTAGGGRAEPKTGRSITGNAACMPFSLAKHLRAGRPPHPEHPDH